MSHWGGPLAEGKLVDGDCVECPWHASQFSMSDGSVHRARRLRPSRCSKPGFATATSRCGARLLGELRFSSRRTSWDDAEEDSAPDEGPQEEDYGDLQEGDQDVGAWLPGQGASHGARL